MERKCFMNGAPALFKEDLVLDCTGLACPMPVMKTRKAVDGMAVGQILRMISTDPGSLPDLTAWSIRTGHELLSYQESGGTYTFYIRRSK
jgi:tRNA 2-thiouridine synthesizing protein A